MAALDEQTPVPAGRALTESITHHKREAEDWALVLVAEGLDPATRSTPDGWRIEVPTDRRADADAILVAWQAERAERRRSAPPPPAPDISAGELALAYALALAMLAFHVVLETTGRHAGYVDAGDSQAALVMDGQLFRIVTALTLHSDLSHVAGNALFGGFFLAALASRLGIGCALLSFLVSGALGNLANAVYYGHAHSSIGASTGVFGLVGVLAGLAAWHRHRTLPRRRGAWVAFAAGLGVVAMLGGPGPKVDFSAHVFGLAAGGLSGLAISVPLARTPRPGRPVQLTALLASLVIVLGAWRFA